MKTLSLKYHAEGNLMLPALGKMSTSGLIDALGELKQALKDLGKLEAYYKEALMSHIARDTEVATKSFIAIRKSNVRCALDVTRIKEDMTPKWIQKYTTETEYETLTIKPLKQEE